MDVLSNVKVPRKAMEQALGGLGDGDEASVTVAGLAEEELCH